MLYNYYTQVRSYEHMLNCNELAKMYRIYTVKSEKPHCRFVAALLKQYYNEHPDEKPIYYSTKNGMMQVFPKKIYEPIMEKIIREYPMNIEFDMEFPDRRKVHRFIIK